MPVKKLETGDFVRLNSFSNFIVNNFFLGSLYSRPHIGSNNRINSVPHCVILDVRNDVNYTDECDCTLTVLVLCGNNSAAITEFKLECKDILLMSRVSDLNRSIL